MILYAIEKTKKFKYDECEQCLLCKSKNYDDVRNGINIYFAKGPVCGSTQYGHLSCRKRWTQGWIQG